MITFNPKSWSNEEIRRMGGVTVAVKRNLKCNHGGCKGCTYNNLCLLMRDIQVMCKKELQTRMQSINWED